MDEQRIVEQTKEFVKAKLDGEGSGHDWWHILRVYNSAIDIAKKENIDGEVNYLIIELGALLHDIADHKFGYDDLDRKVIITEFLQRIDVTEFVINQVVYIANNISFKGGKNKHKMVSLESKIVQDADRLDAMGAIGIGRSFAYGGHENRVMYNPKLEKMRKNKLQSNVENDTISHFYEKLLLLKNKMNTEEGKRKRYQDIGL